MALLSYKPWDQWIGEYAKSHTHLVNRLCHLVGIPIILISLLILPLQFFYSNIWVVALALFILGWFFQFVGHAFEKKPPEFLKDWRFLFVGLRWWITEIKEIFTRK